MRRLAVILAAMVAGLFVVLPGAGADTTTEAITEELSSDIQILEIDQDEGGQVSLVVAVPGAIGQLAPSEDNFGITDGGQLIDFEVAPVTTAVDVVVVLDTSGSMRGAALDAARRAASAFIQQLPATARVGLVSFGETVTIHQRPGAEREASLNDVAGLSAAGETALWDGLAQAAELVEGAEQPFVVVLSDGEDTVSEATQVDATRAIRDVGAGFYAVAIESPDTDLVVLEETAGDLGGQFFDTDDVAELEVLYSDIAGRLASRYELSYPTTRTDSRNVVVSVAIDGSVATARTQLGEGRIEETIDDETATRILNVPDDARLGVVPSPTPGLLGGSNALWVGASLFFLAFAAIGMLMLLPNSQVRLDTAASADRVAGFNNRLSLAADRFIAKRDEEGGLDKTLDAAGMNLRPGEFILIAAVVVTTIGLLASIGGGTILGMVAAALAAITVFAYLSVRADRRRRRFADQLVDTLTIMIGALRAGRGLPQTIELVAQEAPSPTAEQFQRVVFETRVGRDMTESLLNVAERMRSDDLEWVARAIDINRELGGDLTETLTNVADTIRDRRRIARQVQALSAEGRASGWVMLALPFVMYAFTLWRTPDSARLLFTEPTGRIMLGAGLAGIVVGYFWIRKLVDLEY